MARPAHRALSAATPRPKSTRITNPGPDTYTDGIDWIAVERAANREYNPQLLTPAEKHAVTALMTQDGHSIVAISTHLGVDPRQIQRWRAGQKARNLAQCGSYGAYRRHKQRKEDPCGPCHDAYLAYRRARRNQNEETA